MTERDYITCRELIDFIAEYLAGGLTLEQRYEFERHLRVCPSCVNYLNSYKETMRLGREAMRPSDEAVDASVPKGLVEAVRAARKGQR